MPHFAVIWDYTDDASVTEASRAPHSAYVKQLFSDGKLVEAGPWADGSGGLLIFSVTDREELDALVAADPYTVGNVVVGTRTHEWNAALGLVTR